MVSYNYYPKPTRPIYQTTPDIVIMSPNLPNRSQIHVMDTIGSDHVPIKLSIQRRLQPQPNPSKEKPSATISPSGTTIATTSVNIYELPLHPLQKKSSITPWTPSAKLFNQHQNYIYLLPLTHHTDPNSLHNTLP